MPSTQNPFNPDEIRRKAQIGALDSRGPASTTMPVGGGRPGISPVSPGAQTFEGFNFDREQNPNKSAKDSFASLAKLAPTAPTNDKGALAAWFETFIRPGFDQAGHKVSSVDGDKFSYGNHEGNFTVDYGRGAGAEGGALAWQAEPSDDATRARYGAPGGAQAAPAAAPGNPTTRGVMRPTGFLNAPVAGGADPEGGSLARIIAELLQDAGGGPEQLERDAILQMLGGGI